ncbi:hypothetical protein D3C80_1903090 [compost metagenome]
MLCLDQHLSAVHIDTWFHLSHTHHFSVTVWHIEQTVNAQWHISRELNDVLRIGT